MKIAIDCHTLEITHRAGKEQFVYSLIEQLSKIDLRNNYCLYFRRKVSLSQLPRNWRCRFINLPTPIWHLVVLLDAWFKKTNVLFIPATYFLSAINFLIPSVIVVFDLTPFLSKIKRTHKLKVRLLEKMFLGRSIKRAKKIIAISDNTKQDLIHFFPIAKQKTIVVPLAVHRRYRAIKDQRAIKEALKKYNLPSRFILFVGTIEPRKNIVRLIKAYAIIAKKMGIPPLILVGKKGWNYQEIFKIVKESALEKKVIFTGYVSDHNLPYLYNAADLFVYPSLYEGFGLPVLEAMTCGTPVITSNISSLPEVVDQSALLINPNSISEISCALERLLSDAVLREKLSNDGLTRAESFSWLRTAEQVLKIITDVN